MNPALDSNMDAIRAKLLKALDEKRQPLHEHEIYEILGLAGFRVPRTRFVANEKEIDALDARPMPGDEVVCKLISPGMPHRTEFGGIRFVPNDREGARRDLSRIRAHRGEGARSVLRDDDRREGSRARIDPLPASRFAPAGSLVRPGRLLRARRRGNRGLQEEPDAGKRALHQSGLRYRRPRGHRTGSRRHVLLSRDRGQDARREEADRRYGEAPRRARRVREAGRASSPLSPRIHPSRSRRSRSIRSRSRTTGSSSRSTR